MIRIKLSNSYPEWPLLRQTPQESGKWGACQFFVNQTVEECDYWVVYEGLITSESTRCPPQNTIFIAGEPPSVKNYDPTFLSQFATVIAAGHQLERQNVIHTQPGLPWHIGRHRTRDLPQTYDEFKTIGRPQKKKLLSVISSNLTITEGHVRRQQFVVKLCEVLGARIDCFGRGIRTVKDKWDAIADYKYHIVLENSYYRDYWTEKLADVYLAGAYPFYYGCPNVFDYFPRGSLELIDVNDVDASIRTIERAISENTYESSLDRIAEARELVLDKYNLFAMISDYCSPRQAVQKKSSLVLRPEGWRSPVREYISNLQQGLRNRVGKRLRNIWRSRSGNV